MSGARIERAVASVAAMPPEKKILSQADFGQLLLYLQRGEFKINGQDMDLFVELKRKIAIGATGAVQYVPHEFVPAAVSEPTGDAADETPED